jgi:hypothetical protein
MSHANAAGQSVDGLTKASVVSLMRSGTGTCAVVFEVDTVGYGKMQAHMEKHHRTHGMCRGLPTSAHWYLESLHLLPVLGTAA